MWYLFDKLVIFFFYRLIVNLNQVWSKETLKALVICRQSLCRGLFSTSFSGKTLMMRGKNNDICRPVVFPCRWLSRQVSLYMYVLCTEAILNLIPLVWVDIITPNTSAKIIIKLIFPHGADLHQLYVLKLLSCATCKGFMSQKCFVWQYSCLILCILLFSVISN